MREQFNKILKEASSFTAEGILGQQHTCYEQGVVIEALTKAYDLGAKKADLQVKDMTDMLKWEQLKILQMSSEIETLYYLINLNNK